MITAMRWGLLAVLVGGCRCGSEEPASLVATGHYARFDALVEATSRADYDDAAILARDLTAGAPADHPAGQEAAARIGGALGFVQFAEQPDELALAVARAASACGACHGAAAVEAPSPPPGTHATAGLRAVDVLVWNRGAALPPAGDDAILARVRDAWSGAEGEVARASAVLEACAGCHAE